MNRVWIDGEALSANGNLPDGPVSSQRGLEVVGLSGARAVKGTIATPAGLAHTVPARLWALFGGYRSLG